MGVIAGSLHPSTQPAHFCASHWLQGVFSLCSLTGQSPPLSSPHRVVGGAAGLLLGGEVDAIAGSGLWFLEGTASLPRVLLPRGGSQGRNQKKEGFGTALPEFKSWLCQLLVL